MEINYNLVEYFEKVYCNRVLIKYYLNSNVIDDMIYPILKIIAMSNNNILIKTLITGQISTITRVRCTPLLFTTCYLIKKKYLQFIKIRKFNLYSITWQNGEYLILPYMKLNKDLHHSILIMNNLFYFSVSYREFKRHIIDFIYR